MRLNRLTNNESGVVFVTVLILIMVMMIVVVSIISMNVTQVKSSQAEVKRIQAELLGQGMINYYHAQQLIAPQTPVNFRVQMSELGYDRQFDAKVSINSANVVNMNNANKISIDIGY